MSKPSAWQIAVAAEAIAAAQFARAGCDVSVQYGADQPEYDLVVARGEQMLKVSVKGSQDGSWGLTQSLLQNANYHDAIDRWLQKHGSKTVLCFVQFKNVAFGELPRLYLARPADVARRLQQSAAGRGETILYEHHVWTARAKGYGTVEQIPDEWRFSEARLVSLLIRYNESLLPTGLITERGWLTAFACRIVMKPRGRAMRYTAQHHLYR